MFCVLLCITLFLSSISGINIPNIDDLKFNDQLVNPNFGFHEVITEEHWARETVTEDDPPELYAASLDVTLTGKTMLSYGSNKTINCFQGLRYAQKKPKRFTPPLEMVPPYYTESTYVANHLPDKCSQHGIFTPNIPAGTEDCLFLNVYTPILPDVDGNFDELLPVMMFYHGGAFIWGDSSLYLPTRLLEERVILVVPHYRLGSFGFFTTMDERAPGNIGLYDQQMSMKWVQKHIGSFGGDSSRVTIFGQSAGSASVNYHLLIPSSNGLFRNVIGESGSALEHWSLDEDPLASSIALGEILCPDLADPESIDQIYNCLMDLDEGPIALGINTLSHNDRKQGLMGFRGAAPIVQNTNMNLDMFYENDTAILITKKPEELYTDGTSFNKDVNLMIGANKQEGSFVFGVMYSSYIVFNNLTENELYIQEKMIPDLLQSFGIVDKTHSLSESLAEHYLAGADRKDLESCTPGMIDLSGVLFQKAGTMETAKYHSYYKSENVNTYLYAFEYVNEDLDTSFNWLFMGHNQEFPDSFIKGVTHSDELLYIFSWPAVIDHDEEVRVKDRLVKLWTNFATYGDPTPDEDDSWKDLGIPKWPNYDVTDEHYHLMESEFTIQQRYSERWTISNDETRGIIGGGDGTSTMEMFTDEQVCSVEELQELQDERDAFMAAMIVFIIAFVAAAAVCGFFFYKFKQS